MERTLYLFAFRHIKGDGFENMTEEEDRHAHEQWKWIEDQVESLPSPGKAYFDSLHDDRYKEVLEFIDFAIEQKATSEKLEKLPPEFRVMIRLKKLGTIIEATEDTPLMMKYKALGESIKSGEKRFTDDLFRILDDRDKVIAGRIHESLRPGETGFLFQGADHTIYRLLACDIRLGVYWGKAPFPRRKWCFSKSC